MEEKRGRRERKSRGFTRREKPTESKMKEGDARVGGRQGKTGEEREDVKLKDERKREERQRGETVGERASKVPNR